MDFSAQSGQPKSTIPRTDKPAPTDDIQTLYTLNAKAAEGFAEAAQHAEHATLRDALRSFGEVHHTYTEALAAELSARGVEPDTDTFYDIAGDLHKAWLAVMDAISEADPRTLLGECLTGEKLTHNRYEVILRSMPANADVTSLINSQLEGITQIITKLQQMQAAYDNLTT